jgi:ABC-2 type transport system ATP-binding protein
MMLYTTSLTKIYKPQSGIRKILMRSPVNKEVKALNNIELQVKKGEIFGLLGPNGAGKTSLVKIATTLLRPTSGSVTIAGFDVVKKEDEVRKLIGLVTGEERSFYWRLTGRQNLSFYAALCNIERSKIPGKVDVLLSKVGLQEAADNMFYSYSSGMKQKLSIARALLNDPKILFLDEPTKSVDVVAIMEIKELIKKLIEDDGDRAVVLATHRLEEAEELCGRVAIMNKGNVVFCGTASELSARLGSQERYVIKTRGVAHENVSIILGNLGMQKAEVERLGSDDASISFGMSSNDVSLSMVLAGILKAGGAVVSCEKVEKSLEGMFIDVIRGGRN